MRRLERRLGRNVSAHVSPDDILQHASLTGLRHFERTAIARPRQFVSWMMRIAENETRNTSRRLLPKVRPRKDAALPPSLLQSVDALRSVARELEGERTSATPEREHVSQLVEDVHVLLWDHRVTVVLRDFLSVPWGTSAFLLERTTEGAVRAMLSRARRSLSASLT